MPEIRRLAPEERQLAADPGGIQWPEESIILGAFDVDGRLVGRIALVALPHIEGTWVAEDKRGSALAARLLSRMEQEVRELGRTHVFAFTPEAMPKVGEYMTRRGYTNFPVRTWVKEL